MNHIRYMPWQRRLARLDARPVEFESPDGDDAVLVRSTEDGYEYEMPVVLTYDITKGERGSWYQPEVLGGVEDLRAYFNRGPKGWREVKLDSDEYRDLAQTILEIRNEY